MHREFESVPKPLHVLCVFQLSPYLKDSALKELLFLENLFESGFQKSFEDISLATKSLGLKNLNETDMMREVRIAKRQCALLCGLADLGASRKTGSGQPEYASRRLRIYYFRYG